MSERGNPKPGDAIEVSINGNPWVAAVHGGTARREWSKFWARFPSGSSVIRRYGREGVEWRWPVESE